MDVKIYDEKYLKEKKAVPCPRCGLSNLDKKPTKNSLSRHQEKIHICASCGTDEAMLDYIGTVLPIEKWAVARW